MTTLAASFEPELKELNERITAKDAEAASHKEAGDRLAQEMRQAGINPLLDQEAFNKIDAAYKPGSVAAQEAAKMRGRRDALLAMNVDVASVVTDVLNGKAVGRLSIAERMAAMVEYQRASELVHSRTALGTLPDIEINSRDMVRRNVLAGLPLLTVGSDASDVIPIDQQLYPPEGIPRRRVRLLDLINIGATDSDTVHWSKQTTQTSAAASKALKSAFLQATYVWTRQTTEVATIGHFAKAPRENLADLAQLQTLTETELAADLDLKVESLVASGTGSGEDFVGIYQDSDVQANSITRDTTNERRLSALHRGLTKVRLSFFGEPTAIGIHPTDYHETLIEESTSGGFLLAASAGAQEQQVLWGLPAVTSPIFTQNTPLVANFKRATMWLRSGTAIRVTDSNEDDFLTRQIAIVAEMRAGFAVKQPLAFVPVEDF